MSGGSSLARDDNRAPVIGGVSNVDTSTPVAPIVHSVTRRLYVDATTGADITTAIVRDGTTVTTGTNVAIQVSASSIVCKKLTVYAYSTNTNTVAVGTSTVIAESASGTKTGRGEQLLQGAATTIFINDVSKVWLTSVSNGDGISWIAYS